MTDEMCSMKSGGSGQESSHQRVPITEEVRLALRRKRLSLGASYAVAAEYIGVHWSTYRKWETGETAKCTREIERRIQRFLKEETPTITSVDIQENSSRMLDKLIHRLRSTYRLCQKEPRLQERLTVRLEALIDEILSTYSQNL